MLSIFIFSLHHTTSQCSRPGGRGEGPLHPPPGSPSTPYWLFSGSYTPSGPPSVPIYLSMYFSIYLSRPPHLSLICYFSLSLSLSLICSLSISTYLSTYLLHHLSIYVYLSMSIYLSIYRIQPYKAGYPANIQFLLLYFIFLCKDIWRRSLYNRET